ncbi:Argininosuccinate lyase [Streptomyces hirsutus]
MTSSDAGTGLLSPGWAGSPAAAEAGDGAVLRALLDAEAALTRAQAAAGFAPAEAAAAVTEAAAYPGRFDLVSLAERARDGGNPVIPLVADLTRAVGEPHGSYVHRGATSQDIMDTALMLVAHRALGPLLDDLDRAQRALSGLAAEHRDTVLPGRTLTQHAVPTTFGLKAAGWRSLVLDARDRTTAVRVSLPAQLGGAAGTLAAFTAYGATDRPGFPRSTPGSSDCARPLSPGTRCAHRSPISPALSPSPPGPWASSPRTCSRTPAPRSRRSPRAAAAGPRPCRTRPTRCVRR